MTFADGRLGRRYHASVQSCGHPLAARMVVARTDATLGSTCWACLVEDEIKAGRSPGTKRENA